MALHKVKPTESHLLEDVYATGMSRVVLPKFKMPSTSTDGDTVFNIIRDELFMDGNSRQNLSTFCSTYLDDNAKELMALSVDKNMIDKDEYPQTAEIENRCVHILADLWHSPKAEETIGCSTTGSSEAAMLGGLALKWQWKKRRQAQGKPTDKPNLICGPVQVCWEKFARYFDVELRQIPLKDDANGMQPEQLKQYCDENTIGVVATLGITFTCAYEPVKALADELDRIEKETGLNIPLHVDGASGGFIAPFLQPELEWDFRIERVKSINTSGHKYGLSPLGVGWVVWRTADDLPEDLIFWVDYLGGNMPTFALNFSRPAGEIIAQYYNFLHLGFEGYKHIQSACMDTAKWLGEQIAKLGPFELVYNGVGALPAVSYKLKGDLPYSLYDVSDRVRMRGWQIASYPLPPERQETVVQRIMIRHGVSKDMAALLLEDIKNSVEFLEKHPTHSKEHRPSFNHGGHSGGRT